MVLNSTFNNISVISWRSGLFVEELSQVNDTFSTFNSIHDKFTNNNRNVYIYNVVLFLNDVHQGRSNKIILKSLRARRPKYLAY